LGGGISGPPKTFFGAQAQTGAEGTGGAEKRGTVTVPTHPRGLLQERGAWSCAWKNTGSRGKKRTNGNALGSATCHPATRKTDVLHCRIIMRGE